FSSNQIVAAALGSCAAVVLLSGLVLVTVWYRRRKRNTKKSSHTPSDVPNIEMANLGKTRRGDLNKTDQDDDASSDASGSEAVAKPRDLLWREGVAQPAAGQNWRSLLISRLQVQDSSGDSNAPPRNATVDYGFYSS
ncbi:hypothetical protein EGW08_014558, partial [Elysia chlorotica]